MGSYPATVVPHAVGAANVPRGIAPPRWRGGIDVRSDAIGLLILGCFALAIRAAPVIAGAGLFGLHGYDDGVYYASAAAFVHGVIPYRDFLLLHPPGIVLLLAPFAQVGSVIGDPNGLALARSAFMALGALNTVLVALVAGRYSRLAGLMAGVSYAVWSTAAGVERNTDMHGPQSTLLLLGLLVIARSGRIGVGRAALVGALLGLDTAIQLWQGATVLIVLWWIMVRGRGDGWRRLRPIVAYGAGAAIAFGLVCLPFLLADAAAMIQYLLVDQIGRPRGATTFLDRLRVIEGFPQLSQLRPALRALLPGPLVLGAALAALAVVVLTARRCVWTRLWAVLAVAQVLIVLVTPSFFDDYPSFAAPAATLVVGTGLATGARALVGRGLGPRIAFGPIVIGLVLASVVTVARGEGRSLPLADLERDLAQARCVTADSPALLVLTSAMQRDLAAGCEVVVDPTGYQLGSRRVTSPAYQAAMVRWYTSGDAALFVRGKADGLTDATQAAIRARLPVEFRRETITVRLAAPADVQR